MNAEKALVENDIKNLRDHVIQTRMSQAVASVPREQKLMLSFIKVNFFIEDQCLCCI